MELKEIVIEFMLKLRRAIEKVDLDIRAKCHGKVIAFDKQVTHLFTNQRHYMAASLFRFGRGIKLFHHGKVLEFGHGNFWQPCTRNNHRL